MYFALIQETALVTQRDLYWLTRVLEAQCREAAATWSVAPPSFDVVQERTPLPDFCQPMVFVDDDTDTGALAVHYVDPLRLQPAARVYVPRASGFNSGPYSVTSAASHEALEAMVDPGCDQWRDHPDPARSGVQIALELADPVQDEYAVSGRDGDWLVSNYVTPSYFDPALSDPAKRADFLAAGGKFDRLGELKAPGEIGANGYVILRDATSSWTESKLVASDGAVGRASPARLSKPGANHPWARTCRRMAPKVA